MLDHLTDRSTIRPAGYAALLQRYRLEVIPNWHTSFVAISGPHRLEVRGDTVVEIYLARYWPGETLGDHLEFALKYDGTNLAILASLFERVDQEEFLDYLRSKPTGKYARRLWYLYEFLTGKRLPLEDVARGNYIDLLDPDDYYTVAPGRPVRRQRVSDNLPGDRRFCPIIRRTAALQSFEAADLAMRCRRVVAAYSPELLKRALGYLYTKETKSSFEIEKIKPSAIRTERFVALLQLAEKEDFVDKSHLVELQNRIVDPRFQDAGYRSNQNYVGETVAWQHERIHFVGPKPEDLSELMAGLLATHQRLTAGGVSPVAHAAVIAYGFVFLHPFEDGNGRIHRFLIHNILARQDFTPEGVMFPVSAVMLKNSAAYDASLEAFSKKLMPLVDYALDPEGGMIVHNDTSKWYRYIDMTAQVEALFGFIEQTIDTELSRELAFLANYDAAKSAIQEVIDLPDLQIDLFIRFCLQHLGRLSANKREKHFSVLADEEIARMEQAVRASFQDGFRDEERGKSL